MLQYSYSVASIVSCIQIDPISHKGHTRYLSFLKENAELETKRKQVCQEKEVWF